MKIIMVAATEALPIEIMRVIIKLIWILILFLQQPKDLDLHAAVKCYVIMQRIFSTSINGSGFR